MMMRRRRSNTFFILNEVFMIVLALVSLGLLLIEFNVTLTHPEALIIEYASITIGLIFLTEFCVRLYQANDRLHFFRTDWWILLTAIPIMNTTAQLLRGLQILRLLRLFRLVEVIEAAQELEGPKKRPRA